MGAIVSILQQTFEDFEFLIVDDASDDTTLEVVESVRDPRIVVRRNSERMGLTCTLNELLRCARGLFVARMDGDDVSLPQRFENQINALENDKTLWVVGGSYMFMGAREGVRILPTEHDILKARCIFDNPLPHPFVMWRSDFFRNANIFYDENMAYAQDYELWMRLMHRHEEARLGNINSIVGKYRVHQESISVARNKEQSGLSKIVRKNYLGQLGFGAEYALWDVFDSMIDAHVSSDKAYISDVKKFLTDLLAANVRYKIYDEFQWRLSCAQRMYEVCMRHLHLGPRVCRELFTYPDFGLLGISKNDQEKMVHFSSLYARNG